MGWVDERVAERLMEFELSKLEDGAKFVYRK